MQELIAWGKANPGKLILGTSGAGNSDHIIGEEFARMSGVPLIHVPYRGAGPAIPDLLTGRVNVTFFTPEGVDDGTMTGREGTWIESLKRIEGRGTVIIIRKDGNRLESPQLVFDNARNQIFSDSSFVLTRPNKPGISGIGFESDPKLTNLRCIKNCKVFGAVQVPK